MSEFYINIIISIAAFAVLLWSANKFVLGALQIAENLAISPLVIGVTAVAFGTSAPELVVSLNAALAGLPALAVGNALGSNMVNIGAVLGITILLVPISVQRGLLWRELPITVAATLLAGWFLADAVIGRLEGLLLLLLSGVAIVIIARYGSDEIDTVEQPARGSNQVALWLLLLLWLLLMIGSSRLLVNSAGAIATQLGFSQLVIGLTLLAFGTSLPELFASLIAVVRGAPGLAVGNIVGSNIFNILGVIGLAGALAPLPVNDPALFTRDYPALLAITIFFALVLYLKGLISSNSTLILGRSFGLSLVFLYVGYCFYLYSSLV